jgi:hypothetical protein
MKTVFFIVGIGVMHEESQMTQERQSRPNTNFPENWRHLALSSDAGAARVVNRWPEIAVSIAAMSRLISQSTPLLTHCRGNPSAKDRMCRIDVFT